MSHPNLQCFVRARKGLNQFERQVVAIRSCFAILDKTLFTSQHKIQWYRVSRIYHRQRQNSLIDLITGVILGPRKIHRADKLLRCHDPFNFELFDLAGGKKVF